MLRNFRSSNRWRAESQKWFHNEPVPGSLKTLEFWAVSSSAHARESDKTRLDSRNVRKRANSQSRAIPCLNRRVNIWIAKTQSQTHSCFTWGKKRRKLSLIMKIFILVLLEESSLMRREKKTPRKASERDASSKRDCWDFPFCYRLAKMRRLTIDLNWVSDWDI